ncbi:aminoglycoside phosphotransferase family protein [Lachnoclostridium phytofermentans]|uniref:Aminoglycoside phosphotransferase domain-containing protein n=1 Tax=Lachnoclostridium phytofermentans (strain ATCC 700394 / DSM 18823 / ISDg) TaxID=357809 RepID=A9KNM4_LACP7|nr:aminoglycoside phosphotransferase family protein [Lachnoclostridium phytofermentans]ABX41625.1 hypothetical protein Cphy_1247 [Lachnoclostridium phytofermentans ISDg]
MEDMLGKLVGSGGTSNVYEWGNNEVIKIYKPRIEENTINNEMYIGQFLNKFSLNIPKCIGSIDYNGKKALIYERIYGNVMAEPLLKGVYDIELANKFAQMHYDIHKKTIEELPSQNEFLKKRILELKDTLGEKATLSLLNLLDDIPNDFKLCHGDYQPLNIIGEANEYIVIDWNGACIGNPILDVAWSYMTLNSPVVEYLLGDLVSDLFSKFAKDYLSYYCKLSGIKQVSVLKCLPIVATRRLYDNNMNDNENSRIEREWLFSFIRKI